MTTGPRWATWIVVIMLIVSGMEEEIPVLGQGVAHGHRVLHHLGVGGGARVRREFRTGPIKISFFISRHVHPNFVKISRKYHCVLCMLVGPWVPRPVLEIYFKGGSGLSAQSLRRPAQRPAQTLGGSVRCTDAPPVRICNVYDICELAEAENRAGKASDGPEHGPRGRSPNRVVVGPRQACS